MVPDLGSGHVKMHMKINKTPVAYKDKLGKVVKTSLDHSFPLRAQI